MANEETTIDDLAGMIKRGFDGVDKRFDENTKQHQQFFERFEKIDEKFRNVNARLDIIETDVKEIKEEMISKDQHEDLESRVGLLEDKVGISS